MKKLTLIIAGLVLLCGSAYATAPDRAGRWDAGINFSGALNSADSTSDSLFVGGSLDYGYNQWWAFGVSGGWQGPDSLNGDNMDVIVVFGDVILRVPMENQQYVPYLIGGLGYGSADSGATGDDSGFAWKIGAGLDWFLNENWILNLEIAYIDSGANIEGLGDVDFVNIGAGIKYVF